jgi:non-heme chloroperoxidase
MAGRTGRHCCRAWRAAGRGRLSPGAIAAGRTALSGSRVSGATLLSVAVAIAATLLTWHTAGAGRSGVCFAFAVLLDWALLGALIVRIRQQESAAWRGWSGGKSSETGKSSGVVTNFFYTVTGITFLCGRHSCRPPSAFSPGTGLQAGYPERGVCNMAFVTTQDGVNIYFKDWGPKEAQPIVFHHGWPLSADDWDNQMLFFLAEGFRVIAIDRRGHGRSDQVSEGHDMDHYAADVSAVVEHLDLHNAVHVGHSTGGGQVARYARYGQPQGRVAKAVLISAVPPLMVKTEQNPGGTPIEVFDGFRKALAANRAQFYLDVASGPFYGFNRDGAEVSQGTIQNWWRQG